LLRLSLCVCGPPKDPPTLKLPKYFIPGPPLLFPSPSSSLLSSSLTGLYHNPARHRSSFPLYFGRHSRYLVSCLTAGAKRCVGFGPPFSSPLSSIDFSRSSRWFLPVPGSWIYSLNDTTTCKNNHDSAYLPIFLPPSLQFDLDKNFYTLSCDSNLIQVERRFCDISSGALENSVGRYPCFVGVSLGSLSVRSP
jgi:hypothetical protein